MTGRGCGTSVTRDRAALVLVDIQERLAAAMPARDRVVATASLLARVAAILDVPALVTRQYPEGLGDTVPGLHAAGVAVVDKRAFAATGEPGFIAELERIGRTQFVLAGMETHICVTQTALGLVSLGHDVHVVADATCSRRESDHAVALDRLRAAGVTVTTAESAIYEMLERAGTPEFKAVLAEVRAHPLS